MKLLISMVCLMACLSPAHGAPSRSAANAWLNDFAQVKADTLAEASNPKAYLASQTHRIADLEARAKALFTDKTQKPNLLAYCILAAVRYRSAFEWQIKSLNSDPTTPEALLDHISYLASASFEAGVAYQSCEASIEELK